MNETYAKYNLTLSEYKILRLIAHGFSNKEIAIHMFMSTHTIKAHLSIILRKLKAENRSHAVYIATKRQIID